MVTTEPGRHIFNMCRRHCPTLRRHHPTLGRHRPTVRRHQLLLVTLMVLAGGVQAYPTGAGSQACPSESPEVCHGMPPQTSVSPYSILVSVEEYSPGVPVNVTIETTNKSIAFEGFLLGAHRLSGDTTEYLGSFANTTLYHTQCGANGNTGATHTNQNDKHTLTLEWTPPNAAEGELVFTSAVLKEFATFWVNVTSNGKLKPEGYPNVNHTTVPPTNITTVPPTNITTVPPTNVTTAHITPSNHTTPAPTSGFRKDADCGHTRSCYGDCKDDVCSFLATWYKAGQSLAVNIKSLVPAGKDNFWAAIGFGKKAKMNPASVTQCVVNNGQVQAFMSYNQDYGNSPVTPNDTIGLSNVMGSVTDGILSCSLRRDLVVGGGDDVFNLTSETYHILLARGAAAGWSIQPHQGAGNDYVTGASYDVTTIVDVGAKPPDYSLVRLHASLMAVAWLLFGSIGVLVARFYKGTWPSQTLWGVKVWFAIHRPLMFLVFICTTVGFVVIFVHVEGLSQINGYNYQKTHPYLGIVVACLTVINPIMSLFRCAPDDKARPVFNWAHWCVGFSAYILAVITVGIGTTLPALDLPVYATYLVAGFGGWYAVVHFLLEVNNYVERNDSMAGSYRDLQSFSASYDGQKYQYYRHILFALHVVVCLGITIAVTDYIIGD